MKFIKLIFKALYMWYWMLPIRLGFLALVAYIGMMYFAYGSLQMSEIRDVLEANGIGTFFGFFVPFGVPVFLSLGATFGIATSTNAPAPNALEQAIQFRNGQMNISTPQGAADILQKTAHLDLINANKDTNPVFKSAAHGFNAKYGASSPTKVYNDIMNK